MMLAMEKCRFFPPSFATTIVKIDSNLHDGRAADKGRMLIAFNRYLACFFQNFIFASQFTEVPICSQERDQLTFNLNIYSTDNIFHDCYGGERLDESKPTHLNLGYKIVLIFCLT